MSVTFHSFSIQHSSFVKDIKPPNSPLAVLTPKDVKLISEHQVDDIEKLLDENSRVIFGDFILDRLLGHRYLAAGIYADKTKLVGAIVTNVYPNVPAVNPSDWISWIQNQYQLFDLNSHNTLWIHLLAWDRSYRQMFLKPILQFLFTHLDNLEYCVMIVPPGRFRTDFLNEIGSIVKPKGLRDEKHYQYLYVIGKQRFTKHYKFRRAVVEDNDDLVPLIQASCPDMSEIYGPYYIAEILTRSEDRQIVVAEYEGTAVAILCLNQTVNYEALSEDFELSLFNGLRKPDPLDRSPTIVPVSQVSSIVSELEAIDDLPSIKSSSLEVIHEIKRSSSSDFSIVFTTDSLFIFQDEDDKGSKSMELEFDNLQHEEELLHIFQSVTFRDRQEPSEYDLLSIVIPSKYSLSREHLYCGEPNAFALELAACHPEHQKVMSDLFATAFQCFPDRSYCLMTLPSTEEIHKTNSFMHFVPVVQKARGTYPHELYALHKSSLFGNFLVKEVEKKYYREIKQIIEDIPNFQRMWKMILDFNHKDISSYVMLCDDKVIGVAVLTPESDLEYLKAFYDLACLVNLDHHKFEEHGVIECCVVSPVFHQHNKFFLAELLRVSEYSVLYYKLAPHDGNLILANRPLMNFLQEMIHVMPRRLPDYDFETLEKDEWAPPDMIKHKRDPFALYIITMQFCSTRKHHINTRIVIAGWSALALSFLQALVCNQDPNCMMSFQNITVIAPFTQLSAATEQLVRQNFFIKKHFYDGEYLHKLALATYINIVKGKLMKIDRAEQMIVLTNNTVLNYDLLFLMCGEMFHMPQIIHEEPSVRENPDNVFAINMAHEINGAMMKLKQYRSRCTSSNFKIIVYGHTLQSYTTINGLLTYGVKGKHIIFVENFPYSMDIDKRHRHNVCLFNYPRIERAALNNLSQAGVTIYSSYYFLDWIFDLELNIITSALFESRHKILELQCTAMFFFQDKLISPRVYNILNDANLVYDGRLVIDAECRTNDPKIYAAGTLTKYSRKYFCTNFIHKYFNRMEIGRNLGTKIRKLLTPKLHHVAKIKKTGWNIYTETSQSLLPRYTQPLMRYCMLPGELYYLSVTKPGKRVPLEAAVNDEHYGRVIITGSCENLEKQGFFRLHFNEQRRVETITCLAKFKIDVENIYNIWGKHDKVLNNINMRFDMVLIPDLFDYFREPWAYAIYHDKFNELLDELNYIVTSKVGPQGESIINKVISEFKSIHWNNLTDDTEEYLEDEFKKLPYEKMIEDKLLNFLRENITHLPMYAHPLIIQRILYNFQESPMFT